MRESSEFSQEPQFGDIMSDLGGALSSAVSSVGDVITNPAKDVAAIQSVIGDPGKLVSALGDDFGNVAKFFPDAAGSIKDAINKAANNSLVQQALTIATGACYMGAALTVGPLALAIFAAPGLLAGQQFPQAWLQGVVGQSQRALKALSGGNVDLSVLPDSVTQQLADFSKTFTDQLGQGSNFLQSLGPDPSSQLGALAKQLNIPDPTKITPQDIANKLGIREDAAAAALSNVLGKLPAPVGPAAVNALKNASFDPHTGLQTYYWPTKYMQLSQYGDKIAATDKLIQTAQHLNKSPNYQNGFAIGLGAVATRLNDEAVQSLLGWIQGGMKRVGGIFYGPPPPAPGTPIQKSASPPPPPPTGRAGDGGTQASSDMAAGFNAAIAFAQGLGNKFAMDIARANNGVYATTVAGHLIMHGLSNTPTSPSQRAAVVKAISADPNARVGAAAAVNQMANAKLTWWGEVKKWLGL